MRDKTTRLARAWAALAALVTVVVGASPANATPVTSPIIGGTETAITDVPWQVGLVSPDRGPTNFEGQFCGGSIINARWVLTAAHCLADYKLSSLTIFAGNGDLSAPVGTDDYTSTSWIIHPQYTGGFNDIALVRLDTPLDLSGPTRTAIALPLAVNADAKPAFGDYLLASGWGEMQAYDSNHYPTALRSTTLQVLAAPATTTCGSYPDADWNPLAEICVGRVDGSSDTCQGDSGGPYAALGLDGNGDGVIEPTLLGITSWGDGCASAAYPGIATRMTSYLDWVVPRAPTLTVGFTPAKGLYKLTWMSGTGLLASRVTGYRLESSSNGVDWTLAETVAANRMTATERGTPGLQWRIAAVSAVNDGLGPYRWATPAGPTVSNGSAAPSAPLNLRRSGEAPRFVTIAWSAPTSTHGSAIWTYRVYRRLGTVTAVVDSVSSNSFSSLQRRVKNAQYWVVAVNNVGASADSNHLTIP